MGGRFADKMKHRCLDDSEYVERIRRAVALHDRWRWVPITIRGSLVIAFIAIMVAAVNVVQLAGNLGNPPAAWAGFVIGAILGILVGSLGINLAHSFVDTLRSWRGEQLMVRYYDALRELGFLSGSEDIQQEDMAPRP